MLPTQGDSEILFLCTGNTCRSPLAEAVARQVLARLGLAVRVRSAGTAAAAGAAASQGALQVASEAGLDLGTHRARRLTPEMLDGACLILGMGLQHVRAVRAVRPQAPVHLLGEYAGYAGEEVPDPFGGDGPIYRRSFARIRTLVESSMQRFRGGVESEKI